MRCLLISLAAASFGLVGCEARPVPIAAPPPTACGTPLAGDSTTTDSGEAPVVADAATSDPATIDTAPALTTGDTPAGDETAPAGEAAAAAPAGDAPVAASPVAVADGVAALSPENTKIQFVGTHSGAKPDPRTGGFAKFSGQAEIDSAKKLKSVSVEIDTTSLFTSIPKLTDHLKSPDFFEVDEFPTAKFESTQITGEGARTVVTGNLTLHGVTKEISFPATVQVEGEGLLLASQFDIDRTQFGMTYGEGKVENTVSLTVVVGEKTTPK